MKCDKIISWYECFRLLEPRSKLQNYSSEPFRSPSPTTQNKCGLTIRVNIVYASEFVFDQDLAVRELWDWLGRRILENFGASCLGDNDGLHRRRKGGHVAASGCQGDNSGGCASRVQLAGSEASLGRDLVQCENKCACKADIGSREKHSIHMETR